MTATTPRQMPAKLDHRSYLEDELRVMWPAPARLVPGRRRESSSAAVLADFAVLPSLRQPRIVVPRASRRIAAKAVDVDRPVERRERVRHGALTWLFRTGLGQLLFDRIQILSDAGDGDSITTYLSEALGQPVHPTFRIGAPRANRKPVLRLLNDRGTTVGYAKVGTTELTSALVRAEARALDVVADLSPAGFTAPTALHAGRWRDLDLLVQSPLPLDSADANVAAPRRTAAMVELARLGGSGDEPIDLLSSTFWSRLRSSVEATTHEVSDALSRGLDRLADQLSGVRLGFGAWHGDWTPWNMAASADGRLLVWDWERFETDVPLGFDGLHYYFQMIKRGRTPEDAVSQTGQAAPQLLEPFGVQPQLSSTIMVLYAATLASRYASDYTAMGEQTWGWPGSPMLHPLTRLVAEWPGPE